MLEAVRRGLVNELIIGSDLEEAIAKALRRRESVPPAEEASGSRHAAGEPNGRR